MALDCIIFKMKNLFYKRQVTKALILVWTTMCIFSVAFLLHAVVR